jgi:signal transduction histidine kinase
METEIHSAPSHTTRLPGWALSLSIFTAMVALMVWLRVVVYPDEVVTLTYGLPLLLCLWHQDRRLLWAMAGAFAALAAFKMFYMLEPTPLRLSQWTMQVVNILIIGGTVHTILELTSRLRAHNAALEVANNELREREVEITRQNEELHAQAEELAQQNEEIQQQSEEIQQQSEEVSQQAEELQAQTEQLQGAHETLRRRERVLEILLGSLQSCVRDRDIPGQMCEPLLELFEGEAAGAAVLERDGEELVVLASAGGAPAEGERSPFASTLAAIVMEEGRTGFIENLASRPDLFVPAVAHGSVASMVATPLRIEDTICGAVVAYSHHPRRWTEGDFRVIEWAAAQCGLLLTTRRLHRQLIASNEDLDLLVKERTAELQELVNELEHFSYTIAHDLRAPLRSLQGFSAILAEKCGPNLDEEHLDYLARIGTASARMDRLITDALAYSKTVRGEMALVTLDPATLLRGIIDSYPAFQPPRAKIGIEGVLPNVMANEAGLTQCFSNLLGNAVKFVTPGETPSIRIWAEQKEERVRLNFQDNGIGIPEEMQGQIFGMFQRVNRHYEGTGIGLALVRKVAERMGGHVGVESQPNQGSRFWLDLKLCGQND